MITKHGRPVAKLIQPGGDSADLIGSLNGTLKVTGGPVIRQALATARVPRDRDKSCGPGTR